MTAAASAKIRLWREHPAQMVRDLFHVEPDAWQTKVLEAFPHNQRQAMKACKGPGKTTVLAWLCWNFLLCYLHPKIAAVSITADNLKDGLWSEMSKWQKKSPLLLQAFTWTKERIYENANPETWFMSFRTWPKGGSVDQQADTLAGLHADNLMFVIDEAGGVPDAVAAAAEAGLANADGVTKHAHLILAGNPTHLEGPLYRACTTSRDLWWIIEITSDPDDPDRTPRVSAEWARQQIQTYGKDNPWVLVNVFGKFPPSSINALLGPDDITAAVRRQPNDDTWKLLARVLGVDVARFGQDASMVAKRAGQVLLPLEEARNLDSIQGAGWTARHFNDFFGEAKVGDIVVTRKADAIFVDDTGGYGAGWIDQLRALNYTPTPVAFSGRADDPRFYNKRTEMHWRLADWIKTVGCIPDDPLLHAELLAHTYTYRGDRIWVEEKEQVREKIGRSPDRADAAALTHAFPVAPGDRTREQLGLPADFRRGLSHAVQDSYGGGGAGEVYNPMG